ncbi:MAG: hypothetical protein K6C68_14310 [Ruminococcus sp.]|nr:hypothetical protein [Ruminococcus sp.]
MSRSFIVNTKQDVNLTLTSFMGCLQNLSLFDITKLKIWYDGDAIDLDSIEKLSLSIDKVHICFMIEDSYIHITYHDDSSEKWWCIESRALDGIGRSLFVAAASIIADLSSGLADSADGAWHNPDKKYHGIELWKEYLNIELLNSDLA